MPRSLAVLQYPLSLQKNAFIVPELLYLAQALERNWDAFAKKMQTALDKKQIESSDLRALQDAFILLWHRQGVFQFNESDDAKRYTENLYALMTKAQLYLPPEIDSKKINQYVANLDDEKVLTKKIDPDVYRNKAQIWASRAWVAFVALTVAGAGGAALSIGLVAGGWPLLLIVAAVVSWALFTVIEKWNGSISRTGTFADMLARNASGLYGNMKKFSPANLGVSLFVVAALGLAVFAPIIGMIASGLAAFGLVAFMVTSVAANVFHNNFSLFDAGRKFLENKMPWLKNWFQFGFTKIEKDAMPDMKKIKDNFVAAPKEPEVSCLVTDNIRFMLKHADSNNPDKTKVMQNFTAEPFPLSDFKKPESTEDAEHQIAAALTLDSSVPSVCFLAIDTARQEEITVEKYEPKTKMRATA